MQDLWAQAIVRAEESMTVLRRGGVVLMALGGATFFLKPPPRWEACLYALGAALFVVLPPTYLLVCRYVRVISRFMADDPGTYLEEMRQRIRRMGDYPKTQQESAKVLWPLTVFAIVFMFILPAYVSMHVTMAEAFFGLLLNMALVLILQSEVWRRRRLAPLEELTQLDADLVMEQAGYEWHWLWGWQFKLSP